MSAWNYKSRMQRRDLADSRGPVLDERSAVRGMGVQRSVIVVTLVVMFGSVVLGALVGGYFGEDPGSSLTSVRDRPIVATPSASPVVLPPFFEPMNAG